MSSATRMLIQFVGAVACESRRDGQDWQLSGLARDADFLPQPMQLQLVQVRWAPGAGTLPAQLHELIVRIPATAEVATPELAGNPVSAELVAREGSFVMAARAARLHRDASRAFFHAVPSPRVSLLTRFGWALLLTLLRFPPLYKRLIRSAG